MSSDCGSSPAASVLGLTLEGIAGLADPWDTNAIPQEQLLELLAAKLAHVHLETVQLPRSPPASPRSTCTWRGSNP